MRKVWYLVVVLTLISAIFLTGCGSNNAAPSNSSSSNDAGKEEPASNSSSEKSANEKLDFIFHTGSQGGGYMAFGAMFVEEWEKNIAGFKASTVTGGSFTNVIKVEQSKTGFELGASFTTVTFDGINHKNDFAEKLSEPVENLRAIARLNRRSLFLAPVIASAVPEGVTTLGQFLELKPSIKIYNKDRGTGGEIATRRVLEAYGVSYEDIESWGGKVTFSSTSDGVDAVVNGTADGVWQSFAPQAAALQELESSRDVIFLDIDDEIVEKLKNDNGFAPFTAPAEWFKSKKSVNTYSEDTVVYVHKDAPEDVVYEMTKIVLQNKDKWAKGQKAFETFEPENAWQDTIIPLHPGAEKAYKELGFMN